MGSAAGFLQDLLGEEEEEEARARRESLRRESIQGGERVLDARVGKNVGSGRLFGCVSSGSAGQGGEGNDEEPSRAEETGQGVVMERRPQTTE